MYTFGLEQYAYKENGTHLVSVETGDVVFDMGACWGDTALYFAQKQSPSDAQVYSFEFTPGNIEIFSKNVSLNPQFERNIKLVPHPVSDKSGVKIYFTDNGQGSRIEFEKFEGYTHETTTMAIDDFVRENNIQKVDFLKMDIEGSELPALLGAIETIKKFKPKLAIAIYHSWDDFVGIPKFIKDLNLGYELHLGHYTIHTDETIIFAKIKK